jgi:hypothetical protein
MVPFPLDIQPVNPFGPLTPNITSVPSPLGGVVQFVPTLDHRRVPTSWTNWSHGYTGDVYYGTTPIVLTLPAGTKAFYFYAESNVFGTYTIQATATNGTTSGPISVTSPSGASYFGFYLNQPTLAALSTITISSNAPGGEIAVGEFGIAICNPNASTTLACNDNVQLSVSPDAHACRVDLNLDMILEGTSDSNLGLPCPANYARIEVKRGNQLVHLSGNLTYLDQMTSFDGSPYLGRTLTTKIILYDYNDRPLNSCWGTVTIEDKAGPTFDCEATLIDPKTGIVLQQDDTIRIDCSVDPDDVLPPAAWDNCDPDPTVNLVRETITGDVCNNLKITRVYVATDAGGHDSAPCTIVILISRASVTFPEDITWTCEQFAYNKGIIEAKPLHNCIVCNTADIDAAEYCCLHGQTGDDVPGVEPYVSGAQPYWLDGEDLDVHLDPLYDDNIDNPLDPQNTAACGETTREYDDNPEICNLSIFAGCPYLDECISTDPHHPSVTYVPVYVAGDVRGLEDADVLAATGSGVPNVWGKDCNYAISYSDQRLEACEGLGTSGPVFKILRTWTALDWCTGTVYTDVQVIKVIDKKAPEVSFDDFNNELTADQSVQGPHTVCGSSGLLDVPTVSDNCTGIGSIRVFTPVGQGIPVFNLGQLVGFRIPSPYLHVGKHTITYEVSDKCGNVTSADVEVTVIDGFPPIPVCREVTQVALGSEPSGFTKVEAKFFDEGSYDNCGPVYFKVLKMTEFTCNNVNIDSRGEIDAKHEWFDDFVYFCCEDIKFDASGKPIPIQVILRVYDVLPGTGAIPTVRSNNPNNLSHNGSFGYLNENHYNDCMIEVYVEDKVRPTCKAPADIWTTCLEIPDNIDYKNYSLLDSLFGKAVGFDNCQTTLQPKVETNLDVCGVGSIIRSWTAVDNSGNKSFRTCYQTIMVAPVIDYDLNIPSDFESDCSVANPDNFTVTKRGCDLLAITHEDLELPLSPGGECKKILRKWTIIDWCDYDGFSRPLELPRLDRNGDTKFGDAYKLTSDGKWLYLGTRQFLESIGYYTYEQHIKIFDREPPKITPPANLVFCGGELDEDPCTGLVDIAPTLLDRCTPNDITLEYQIDLFNDGTFDIPAVGRATGVVLRRLPLGKHRVRFFATDGCGNVSQLDVNFEVKDCKKPTVVCINGLSTDLMSDNRGGGMVTIWAQDWDASSSDFCSAVKLYVNRITDRDGDGITCNDADDAITTVPSTTSVTFTCDDLGCQGVQLWACDAAGNCDYCITFIDIQDNMNVCSNSRPTLGGKVSNEEGESVQNVQVELNTGATTSTGTDGQFSFAVVPGNDYTVTPSRDDSPLNGVTTFDLVLISKHILNVTRFDSPFKMIAADANNSRSITTLDLVALRKLILRIDNQLPNNTSWRFVEKGYRFPNPQNPWTEPFPEVKNYNNVAASILSTDFVAIKVGDVNGSSVANSLLGVDVRTFNGNLVLRTEQQQVKAGEEFRVALTANENVLGYQFTLDYATTAAELKTIEYGVAGEGNFNVANGSIATSWNDDRHIAGETMFTLVMQAKTDLSVAQILSISSALTPAEAYGFDGELKGVALDFGTGAVAAGFALHQNTPNPFKGMTTIGFNLPEATQATISISDASGKVLKVVKGDFDKGYNNVELSSRELPASGVLYYQLSTSTDTATRKMIVIE